LGSEALGVGAAAEKKDAVSDATILSANQKQKQTKKSHRVVVVAAVVVVGGVVWAGGWGGRWSVGG
jgi:hypothetical protein